MPTRTTPRSQDATDHADQHRRPHPDALRVPGYRVTAALPDSALGPRFLATRRPGAHQFVLHPLARSLRRGLTSFAAARASRDARRFLERTAPVRDQRIPHTVPVADAIPDTAGWHWLATPYLGTADGLTTLDRLRRLREHPGDEPHHEHADPPSDHALSQLSQNETAHAARHLLTASMNAHAAGIAHGPIEPAAVLIDKHGSLHIELYALQRLLQSETPTATDAAVRAELRSIAAIAYTAITGTLDVPDPYIDASRLDARILPSWDRWLDYALDPSRGFDTAADALRHLPPTGEALPGSGTRQSAEHNAERAERRPAFAAAALRLWRARST